jgi:two-component system sensor histidine kinase YesM
MLRKKIRISLKIRIFMIFLGIFVATVCIFTLSFYRFVSKSTFENLNEDYLAMVNDLNDTSQNLLWKLTLTSQQLMENEDVQNTLVSYQEAENVYEKQSYYSDLLDEVASLTMSETDVALFYFYDLKTQEIIYSSLPVDYYQTSDDLYLYKNKLFQYRGPASSQSSLLGNPVFILDRITTLPNGNTILFSIESGYYSLDKSFQALKQKDAYVIFVNENQEILYNSMPEQIQENVNLRNIFSDKDHNFHVFMQESSQGWSTYVVVPHSVYTAQYRDGLRDFTKYTIIFAITLSFFALLFWHSIYHPLQIFDHQLEQIVTDQEISGENPSSIPEFDFLFQKIKHLQKQVQMMLEQAVVQEKANTKAQLEKLRAQINPHFLMNTLNTVHWLALINKQTEIDEITQSLSHLLSYNLDKDSYNTYLQKELNAVSEYVRLQKVRYQFDFAIRVIPEDSTLNYPCPKFILQPFIENALSHGYRENMNITIEIAVLEHEIAITISDTGSGMTEEELLNVTSQLHASETSGCQSEDHKNDTTIIMNQHSGKGIGLSYVAGILRLYYYDPCSISVTSSPDVGTSFCIHLPKMKGRGYLAKDTDH